jgi:hypothetical protein
MKINWTLDLNEANVILAVLGKLPYEQVHTLIGGLQAQTQRAVDAANFPAPPPAPAPDVPGLISGGIAPCSSPSSAI